VVGTITCKSPVSIAPLGAELVLNGTFNSDLSNWTYGGGSDWTWDAAGKALHASGNTTPITQDISVSSGEVYLVTITGAGATGGLYTLTLGGAVIYNGNSTDFGNGAYTTAVKAVNTGSQTLSITPVSAYDGTIDTVSVKLVNSITPALIGKDDSNESSFHLSCDNGLLNFGIGNLAGLKTVTGAYNMAWGSTAGKLNVTGVQNIFIGQGAGEYNVCGSYNAFIGFGAGNHNIAGQNNSFIGLNAGQANTIGCYNSCIGVSAGFSSTTGYYNSFIGTNAGYSNTTGNSNSFIGLSAGFSNTTGSQNVCIGEGAGRYQNNGSTALETPENSIYIGYKTKSGSDPDGGEDAITNEVVLGYDAVGDGANTTTLGNSSTLVTKVFGDIQPGADNTYYLGKNDDDSPRAYKGVILKDTTNGVYYRIEIINGTITATSLAD
jgi:hypothetical protein